MILLVMNFHAHECLQQCVQDKISVIAYKSFKNLQSIKMLVAAYKTAEYHDAPKSNVSNYNQIQLCKWLQDSSVITARQNRL
jgi:hypothetical protein